MKSKLRAQGTTLAKRRPALSALAVRGGVLAAICLLGVTGRAEDFGDVSATASAMYTGNTFHGYAETRVLLENHSASRPHNITLVTPNRSYNNAGNSLSKISRSVTLAPGARVVLPLLLPPLPANGDGSICVVIDGNEENTIRQPNANNHCNLNNRGNVVSTLFISRSLDFDAVERVFEANHGAFTAAMAVGTPDASRGVMGGWDVNTWMPDTRRHGQTNWLDLDYATPQIVSGISIHHVGNPPQGFIELIGVSGTNLMKIPMSSGTTGSSTSHGRSGSAWNTVFTFPATSKPVKMLHLNFEKTTPSTIMIDAVEISGPSGSQWASAARASSDNSASAPSHTAGHGSADSIQSLRAESAIADWSDNWLAYTPFDVIVLSAADVSALPAPVMSAIGNYLQAGGNVIVFGSGSIPAAWPTSQRTAFNDGQEFVSGLGRIFILSDAGMSQLTAPSMRALRDAVTAAARYWEMLPANSAAANSVLPIVENLKIPVRGIVIIMLLFIIAIGPVNIFILIRKKRRTWMLWTIPAISVATTLLVFVYSLVREGVTPNSRIAGLTVLDQASHHAATVGGTGFYCPLTPGGGLTFDGPTEATPLVTIGYSRSGGAQREVDWTQGQHLRRGWVAARVPAHFHLRKSESRRERIEIVNENGHLQVVNGLGAPILSLWVADADMNIYEASHVGAGQKAVLTLAKNLPNSEKTGPRALLRDFGFAASTKTMDVSGTKYLQPRTYIAELEGNPFIENALGAAASPKRTRSSSLVFGILEPVATP